MCPNAIAFDPLSVTTRALLTLARAPGLSGLRLRALLEQWQSPEAIVAAGGGALKRAGLSAVTAAAVQTPDWPSIERDQHWLAANPDRHLVAIGAAEYPPLLAAIADPPAALFVEGDIRTLSLPQLAIVGSRNPTPGGSETAFAFAAEFARHGLIVTSGLAIGIDAAAHQGALDAQGATIAVLGNGIGAIYPRRHQQLAARIVAGGGAIVTQYPSGVPPIGRNFPHRNRLISGLSIGVIVVEAAKRSGSLVTARCAAEQGREVFAVPGSIYNPLTRGCHALIRDGATLTENVADVLAEVAPWLREAISPTTAAVATTTAAPTATSELDAVDRQVLKAMGYDPTSMEVLIQRSGLTAAALGATLSNLELQDLVVKTVAGHYARR